MAEWVYVLCAVTSLFCAALLWRSYRRARTRLLLLSTCCFVGLALSNVVLVIDLLVLPDRDLQPLRTGISLIAMFSLVVGLISEDR